MPALSYQRRATVYRAAAFLLLAAALAHRAAADEVPARCCGLRAQDQLWLVSQRGLGCDVARSVEHLKYWRYDCQRRWVPASLPELLAAESGEAVTTVFVHGNRMSASEAFGRGWAAYRALVQCADERPVRFIIWSWPSDQLHGVVQDVRVKAGRTVPAAYYLAWFVDQLDPQAPVGLWGHSFGARIITGALHLLGGGRLRGDPPLERAHQQRAPVNVVLAAAALDNDWLLAGRAHGLALSQVESLLLLNNGCDPVLKRYHRLYHRRACQRALGYAGLPNGPLDSGAWARIRQVNACCQVGKEHGFAGYLASGRLMALARGQLLSGETAGESTEQPDTAQREDGPLLVGDPVGT